LVHVVEEVCDEKWSATITIPRKYLPADVNKFNAYAARGKQYGTAEVSREKNCGLPLVLL
jgi:hypothetical protein